MNNQPLHDFPKESEESKGEKTNQRPNMLTIWKRFLTQKGFKERLIRIGTNILAILLIVMVVFLLKHAKLGAASNNPFGSDLTPVPTLAVSLSSLGTPSEVNGIKRQADLHTIIPNRPRIDVIKYTVLSGDSLFRIAENFGLKPGTILFGNWSTLKDYPNLIKPGQELNILPVDGMYYQWKGVEDLTQVAQFYSSDVEAIINFPGNHLDSDTLGDLSNPNIPPDTWLILPGGKREFSSWTAPAQLVLSNPTTSVWGPGVCTGIQYAQVGYGSFIYPTTEHWLSGTPFSPDIGHYGVDFAGSEGNAVFAADAGTVVYSGWNTWGYGNLIIIDHGNGWQSLYAHLSAIFTNCGQNVGQGDTIGLIGMTGGTSTGPHLHFELMNASLGRVNPLDFLPPP
jgi:murein DD-endopeptidase MepM/ murein hydrolase activator NlpD